MSSGNSRTKHSYSSSNEKSPKSQDSGTNGGSSSVDSTDSLMFPKREVSSLTTRRSTSSFTNQASALKRHRRIHHHHYNNRKDDPNVLGTSCDCPCPSPPKSPVLHANEHMRIRTPASAVPSRASSLEIGARMPFDDRKNSTASVTKAPGAATTTSDDEADAFFTKQKAEPRHYEIARVVMSTPSSPSRGNGLAGGPSATTSTGSDTPGEAESRRASVANLLPLRHHASQSKLAESDLSVAPTQQPAASPLKQIRDPKQPLYIPAVLRPTSKTSYQTQRHPSAASAARQSSVRPPTRQHWAPDASARACTACAKDFGLIERRHHCRKCGQLFCANDSRFMIGLDQTLSYNLFGFPSRACRGCWDDFTTSILQSSRLTTDPTPVNQSCAQGVQGITIGQRLPDAPLEQPIAGSLMPNMPVDWNWSTF